MPRDPEKQRAARRRYEQRNLQRKRAKNRKSTARFNSKRSARRALARAFASVSLPSPRSFVSLVETDKGLGAMSARNQYIPLAIYPEDDVFFAAVEANIDAFWSNGR